MGGAKKIIALEPIHESYELARKNIDLNECGDKIELVNAGCCGVNKKIFVERSVEPISSAVLKETFNGIPVKLLTLRDIIELYDIDNAVLKIDCEGCEYETVLMSDRQTLRKFDQIQIEFHHGARRLVKKLRSYGFQVHYSFGKTIGYIYAIRRD